MPRRDDILKLAMDIANQVSLVSQQHDDLHMNTCHTQVGDLDMQERLKQLRLDVLRLRRELMLQGREQ